MTKAAIIGIAGPELRPEEHALLQAHPPAGVILFARNIRDPAQLALLVAGLRRAMPPGGLIMIDQEGGRVARLRPPHWEAQPAAGRIGAVFARDPATGLRAAWLCGAMIGADCRTAGIDVVCAPVLDLVLPGASDVVGDRGFAAEPASVARLGRAMAAGLLAAGIQPVGKHAPGHGRARVDSHLALPVVEANDLEADLVPFAANADLPWMMTAHILYPARDPARPATLSAPIIADWIRGRAGFGGVLVSDDLAMQALDGTPAARAQAALEAGCDLALYCPGDFDGTRAVLAAVPDLTPAAQTRLAAAATMAQARHIPLNATALRAERDRLLA